MSLRLTLVFLVLISLDLISVDGRRSRRRSRDRDDYEDDDEEESGASKKVNNDFLQKYCNAPLGKIKKYEACYDEYYEDVFDSEESRDMMSNYERLLQTCFFGGRTPEQRKSYLCDGKRDKKANELKKCFNFFKKSRPRNVDRFQKCKNEALKKKKVAKVENKRPEKVFRVRKPDGDTIGKVLRGEKKVLSIKKQSVPDFTEQLGSYLKMGF